MPGGTMRERGAIVVIGSPASSSSWRTRYEWRIWYPSNGSSSSVIAREPLHARHPVPARNDEPEREAVLRRKRTAVHLVREEGVALAQQADRQAPLVGLLLLALDTAVEAAEQRLDCAVAARQPPRAAQRRERRASARCRPLRGATAGSRRAARRGRGRCRRTPSSPRARSPVARRSSSNDSDSGRSTRPPISSRQDAVSTSGMS